MNLPAARLVIVGITTILGDLCSASNGNQFFNKKRRLFWLFKTYVDEARLAVLKGSQKYIA